MLIDARANSRPLLKALAMAVIRVPAEVRHLAVVSAAHHVAPVLLVEVRAKAWSHKRLSKIAGLLLILTWLLPAKPRGSCWSIQLLVGSKVNV